MRPIGPMKTERLIIVAILLALVSWGGLGSGWAAALDVSAGGAQPADSFIEWCATPASASAESVIAGACKLELLTARGATRGVDRRAFWMRLELINPSSESVERWISIGHPRLAEVTLYVQRPSGLARRDTGKRTPMSQRGEIERTFGVMPVNLGPGASQMVWLRVWSDTAVDLSTTVWQPNAYIREHQLIQFWVSLSLGGLFIVALFALVMHFVTREQTYAFFVIWLSGALFNIAYTNGLAQRFLWPMNWPLRSEYVAVSVLVGLVGFFGFTRAFLPCNVRASRIYRLFAASVLSTAILLVYGGTVDYSAVLYAWNSSLVVVVTLAVALTYTSWRRGDGAAGILLLGCMITLAWGLLRVMISVGGLTWFSQAGLIGAWVATVSAAISLLSLMSRSREQLAKLAVIQAENEARLTFLAHMSHELRSPLDTILGNAQLLGRSTQDPSSGASLSSIFQSGRHMLRLVDHILDYARGLAGVIKICPEPVRLASFLRSIERMARLHAARQNNRFILRQIDESGHAGNVELLLDADHLRRVLDNLISNAARHTRGGIITLDVKISLFQHNHLRLDFSVCDTGEGISPENLQRIFQPFDRGDHKKASDGKGTGLGLAIARQLTELMGGRLTVTSEPGKGATFSFGIVAECAPAGVETADAGVVGFEAAGYMGRRRTILIVDDNTDNRSVLSVLLRDLGFRIIEAESGVQAGVLLKTLQQLDLVITDQVMKDGDGWMVLERLSTLHSDVPAILISAAPASPPRGWLSERQFSATFLRPLDHSNLVQRIGDLLGLNWIATEQDAGHRFPDQMPGDDRPAAVERNAKCDEEPLDQEDLRILASLVQTGQVTALEGWATKLKARFPDRSAFADRVITAARELDLETLKKLARID